MRSVAGRARSLEAKHHDAGLRPRSAHASWGAIILCLALLSPARSLAADQSACDPQNPLGGWISWDREWDPGGGRGMMRTQTYFIRFKLTGDLRVLVASDEIRYEVEQTDVSGFIPEVFLNSYDPLVCERPGGVISGTQRVESLGTQPIIFHPLDPSLVFQAWAGVDGGRESPPIGGEQTCRAKHSSALGSARTLQIPYLDISPVEPGPSPDSIPFKVTIPATPCYRPRSDKQQDDCIRHPEKYAVVPFRGHGQANGVDAPFGWQSAPARFHVVWDVCCGCGSGEIEQER
jgi:hypothetical protein